MPTKKRKEEIAVPLPLAPPMPPTTTAQEDKVTERQSRINLIWELTQAIVAIAVTFSVIYAQIKLIASDTLVNAFFLIIGFYFSRTNHQAIGGVGRKTNESQPYEGR